MKKFFPIVAFIAVALISLTMAGFAYFATQEAARIKFEATADDALNRIESRIDLHLSLLRSTQALFDARNGDISRGEFKAFFSALDVDNNFAGLRGIGFLRLAKTGDEAAVERDILHDHGVAHAVYPDTTQPWRTPIVLFEPLDPSNQSSIGYDMFTDPVRREAIEKAMADDQQHASGLVQLGQGTGAAQTFTGFLVFVRLNVETAPDVINASRSSTSGFLYAAFRARDLFQTALSRTPLLPVNTEIYDGKVDADNLLFQSETPPVAIFGDRLLVTRKIIVAGRPWTVLFRPTSAFSQPSSRAIPVMLGLFGLLLAGAIALVARYQERAYDAVSLLHETTEKSLLEKDLMLQEMKHRIKNSITRVLAIARQTAVACHRRQGVLGVLLGPAAGDGGFPGHADALALAEGRSRRSPAHRAWPGVRQGASRRDIVRAAGAARRDDDAGARPDLSRTGDECAEIWRGRQFGRRAEGRLVVRRARARQDAGSELARGRAEEARSAGQDRLRHQADRPQCHARIARHDQARFSR